MRYEGLRKCFVEMGPYTIRYGQSCESEIVTYALYWIANYKVQIKANESKGAIFVATFCKVLMEFFK
jgi:hypothetical protein